MTSNRYVPTWAIREALKSREAEVLKGQPGRRGVIADFGARHWRWRLEVVG